ncbi:hypothetical protein [Actinokineospora fastidiosa]|uniref:Uncharacterized protein n=1 Tax=Actinokineospora fastidiosa TaxID=1816 RepID=A0A918GME3_9PSEU|nr:hypothetical protein [Actinokineospora fastidiosa]GGS46505.1 hypothetical protein GCM10010171_47140 [Actinokineospora fastidiosa]
MSKTLSAFLAAFASSLVALCVVGAGTGSATSSDDGDPAAPPTTTTTATTEGNPWHG